MACDESQIHESFVRGQHRLARIIDEGLQGQKDRPAQKEAVHARSAREFIAHREAGDQHGAEDEEEKHPLQGVVIEPFIGHFNEKKNETADERYDERRT